MYDYIVLDTAPVGMVSDTFSLVRVSDATVYVCRAKYSTMREVNFINDIYHDYRMKNSASLSTAPRPRKDMATDMARKGPFPEYGYS